MILQRISASIALRVNSLRTLEAPDAKAAQREHIAQKSLARVLSAQREPHLLSEVHNALRVELVRFQRLALLPAHYALPGLFSQIVMPLPAPCVRQGCSLRLAPQHAHSVQVER